MESVSAVGVDAWRSTAHDGPDAGSPTGGNLMKWSRKIGTFAGIGVYVHTTFIILLAWVAFAHWQTGHNVGAAVRGVAFILAIFGCVVLHEFGHALTAKRFGIKTRDITLLPIGGIG